MLQQLWNQLTKHEGWVQNKSFLKEIVKSKVNSGKKGSVKCRKQDCEVEWEEDLIESRGIPLMGGSCVNPVHSTQFVRTGSQTVRLSAEIKSSPSCSRPADSAACRPRGGSSLLLPSQLRPDPWRPAAAADSLWLTLQRQVRPSPPFQNASAATRHVANGRRE